MVDVTVQVILWSSSELALSSICICTPSLRTVWRNYFASGSRGATSAATRGYRLDDVSKNVESNPGYSIRIGRTKGSSDNESDENILRQDESQPGIKLTSEVQVSYAEDRGAYHSPV